MCDLRDVVRAAADLARARPDAPRIGLGLPSEAITAEVDPDRLGEVVLNLLMNAVTHATGATRIDARLTATSDGIGIEVEDDGAGIPAEDLPHIFSRYYQALRDHAHGHTGDGLGLGLFIAQQLVTAHGGRLDVETTLGAGTRFTIGRGRRRSARRSERPRAPWLPGRCPKPGRNTAAGVLRPAFYDVLRRLPDGDARVGMPATPKQHPSYSLSGGRARPCLVTSIRRRNSSTSIGSTWSALAI
jgi:anti-sigma regulatory factor (Ser/Thr protein kinase)